MALVDEFNKQKCTLCGECFHQCPVMNLPLEIAKDEIARLIDGRPTKYVLKKCESCMACNLICPEACNPTQLILKTWQQAYQEQGLPSTASYFMPHSKTNFRTYVIDRMPEDEKALIEKWADTYPCEEIFYPGCNWITVPYLSRTSLLDGMNIRGSLDVCCGEMYFRMGHFDELKQVAQKLTKHYRQMGIKRMYIACTAGLNMFTNVLPRFGAEFDFEVKHIMPMFLERIESGEIKIKNKLNMTVTIQESCHAKCIGEAYLDIPRKILEHIGVNVVEEKYSRDKALCCGIGGGFSHESGYNPLRLTQSTVKAMLLARQSGAEAIVTYCAGCLQTLAIGGVGLPFLQMPMYHLIELIQLAIGEQPQRLYKKRARQMFTGILRHQVPAMLSSKRFYSEEIK
jgi:Fe-S oxidoreductase